jgi:hypothetical protein
MKTKLTLVLLLAASINGFAQTKAETVKTINLLLAKAIGGTDSAIVRGKKTEFTLTANSFSVEEEKKYGIFKIAKIFKSPDKEESTGTSVISDWKGFKVSPEQNSTTLKSIYPIIEKREGEPDNDKNGIKYYCLAGDEEKLIAALMHLQNLYSKSN